MRRVQMIKKTKLTVLIATLGLLLSGTSTAIAGPSTTLTFAEFAETAGYKDLQEASKASAEYVATQSGLVLETSTEMAVAEETFTLNTTTEATKSGIHMVMSAGPVSAEYWLVGGKAYMTMDSYLSTLAGDYPSNLVKVIPNGATRVVQMTTIPEELTGSTPDEFFSPNQDLALSKTLEQYGQMLDLFTFSEVTKQINPNDPTIVDYEFDMGYNILGMTGNVHEKATFKNGFLTSAVITSESALTGSTVTTATYEINNDLVITAPASNKLITEASVKKVIAQEYVKGQLQAQANVIIKKAATLAKKAKAKVAATHLQSAASSLRTKYTKITNGIKISATISKVKGNLCITAVKGKTSTKTC
jgi:hypothetical protein